MKNSELIFLSNELLDEEVRKFIKVPMEFITFAITDGKMYSHYNNNGVFFIQNGRDKNWGNTKVYGVVFLVKDYFFYSDLLDAYHVCSFNKIKRNHIRDIHHRVSIDVTPIKFDTIDELNRLQYREAKSIKVVSYIGNTNHPNINKRFLTTKNYRKVNGVNEKPFIKLYREVTE